MRTVVCAPPTVDVSAYVRAIAGARPWVTDPARELCRTHGFQTLYEAPAPLQKALRRELIAAHLEALRRGAPAVYDHGVFAWLADWMRWLWSSTPAEEWEGVLLLGREAAQLCDEIHHVARGPRAAYDGYRWLDSRSGKQAESLMRHLYGELGVADRVRHVELPES